MPENRLMRWWKNRNRNEREIWNAVQSDWKNRDTALVGERCLSDLSHHRRFLASGAFHGPSQRLIGPVSDFTQQAVIGFGVTTLYEGGIKASFGNEPGLFGEMPNVDFRNVDWRQISCRIIHAFRQDGTFK